MTVLHLLSVRTKNRWWVRHRPPPCYKLTELVDSLVAFGYCFQGLISSSFFTLWPLPSASQNFLYLFCLHACIYEYHIHAWCLLRTEEVVRSLGTVLQMVVSHQVCVRNQDLWKNSQCSQPLSQLSSPIFFYISRYDWKDAAVFSLVITVSPFQVVLFIHTFPLSLTSS